MFFYLSKLQITILTGSSVFLRSLKVNMQKQWFCDNMFVCGVSAMKLCISKEALSVVDTSELQYA